MLRFVYERALEYVKIREQFGKPLIEFQAVQLRIADMAIQLEAARLMVYRALSRTADGMPSAYDASTTKIFVNEVARKVTDDAIQLFGGAGYLQETGIERLYRYVRGYECDLLLAKLGLLHPETPSVGSSQT